MPDAQAATDAPALLRLAASGLRAGLQRRLLDSHGTAVAALAAGPRDWASHGIPAEDLRRILLPFWTRRADGSRGSGLGLPLVLSALNEVFYNFYLYVFGFLVRGRLNFGYYFINIILPETIFTVVTTLILYRLFLYISRKLEEMEKRRDTTIV